MWRLRFGALPGEGTLGGAEGRGERACRGLADVEDRAMVPSAVGVDEGRGARINEGQEVRDLVERCVEAGAGPADGGRRQMVRRLDCWKRMISTTLRNEEVIPNDVTFAVMYLCQCCRCLT